MDSAATGPAHESSHIAQATSGSCAAAGLACSCLGGRHSSKAVAATEVPTSHRTEASTVSNQSPTIRSVLRNDRVYILLMACMCRSKPGASARDVKHSVELLKFAAGLVPAASARQYAGAKQGTKPQTLPVQGFPDLAFNATGRADALRELALAYQVSRVLWNYLLWPSGYTCCPDGLRVP